MDKLNIINNLFLSLSSIVIFISLFKLYYGSNSYIKNNIIQKSLIRVISFFILFFMLFYFVNFYLMGLLNKDYKIFYIYILFFKIYFSGNIITYITFIVKNALFATNIFVLLSMYFYKLNFPTWWQSIKLGSVIIITYCIIYFGLYYLFN